MQTNNNEFSTFDVARIIGIERSRLVHWMNGKFIPAGRDKPWGRGFKTVFSLFDLYSIALFKECVDFSLSREVAKQYWSYVNWENVIKEKKWLMAVKKTIGKFIREKKIKSIPRRSGMDKIPASPRSELSKSSKKEVQKGSIIVVEPKTYDEKRGKLPTGETARKSSFASQPIESKTGETIIFEKNFQSMKKKDFNERGIIIFMIDLKSIVDEVDIAV